jgi:putative Holliday junction resolvase
MRILGVDPGEKWIGLSLSDPLGMVAKPLSILQHISRPIDAATIAQLAAENEAGLIVVGQATEKDGTPNVSGRRAARLAGAIRTQTDIPVKLWDESYSTEDAKAVQIRLGGKRKKQRGHLDDIAAAVILQSYLDANQT